MMTLENFKVILTGGEPYFPFVNIYPFTYLIT